MMFPHLPNLTFHSVRSNWVALHTAQAGPVDGPLVVLLHGFPEFWYGWRNQIAPLAEAGFRVVAVDQRGYNLSEKPAGIEAYDLDLLAADVAGIADVLDRTKFSIVGHDWGGIVATWAATKFPARLDRIAVLNAAHPSVWREAIATNPEQRRKSWYVRALQLPKLPEWGMRLHRFRALVSALKTCAHPEAFSEDDLHLYRGAWQQAGALTAMVNWYRSLAKKELPPANSVRIDVPALILWGVDDRYAVRELAAQTAKLCSNAKVEYFEKATHWIQHDEAKAASERLVEFLVGRRGCRR